MTYVTAAGSAGHGRHCQQGGELPALELMWPHAWCSASQKSPTDTFPHHLSPPGQYLSLSQVSLGDFLSFSAWACGWTAALSVSCGAGKAPLPLWGWIFPAVLLISVQVAYFLALFTFIQALLCSQTQVGRALPSGSPCPALLKWLQQQ